MNRRNFNIVMILAVLLTLTTISCQSKVVPPGTTVIVLTASGGTTIKKSGSYTAYGRDKVYFVDTKLKSFTEPMKILCKDDINMDVDVKWLGSFHITDATIDVIKDKVPAIPINTGDQQGYSLSLEKFYQLAMMDVVRSNSRAIVSPYITDNIRAERKKIEAAISKAVIAKFKELKYPIATSALLVSNLDYPEVVKNQREEIKEALLEDEKQAALAEATLAQASRAEDIAREEGKAEIIKARTKAASNMIVTSSLTSAILVNRQYDVMERMADSPNNQVFVFPYDALRSGEAVKTVMNNAKIDELIASNAPLTDAQKAQRDKNRAEMAARFKKEAAERKQRYQAKLK